MRYIEITWCYELCRALFEARMGCGNITLHKFVEQRDATLRYNPRVHYRF